MPIPFIEIIQPLQQLKLAFLRVLFHTPRMCQLMGFRIINAVIGTSVKRDKKQRLGLFGFDRRKYRLDCRDQCLEHFLIACQNISRKQYRIEFAAHHIRFHPKISVLRQDFPGKLPVCFRYAFRMMQVLQCAMKPGYHPLII